MAWGISNLLSAARTAAGGPIAVIGAVTDNTPGSYLGGIEKIHQAMGGVRGLASERLAQNTGINSLRTMGNILAKGRVTLTSRTDFEQKEYPSFGEGDIFGIFKTLAGVRGDRSSPMAKAALLADRNAFGRLGTGGAKEASMVSDASNPGIRSAGLDKLFGISNLIDNPKSNPRSPYSKSGRRKGDHPLERAHRSPAIDAQKESFEKQTSSASFGGGAKRALFGFKNK